MLKFILNIIAIGLTTSNILFAANLDSLMIVANQNYSNGKYDEAVKGYEAILNQGYESDQLYYNLGNAFYKLRNVPAAILNFEKAARLNPSDEDINFNLELAKTYTVDKIEPLPEFFLKSFIVKIRNLLSTNGWAYLSIISLIFCLLLASIFWFTYQAFTKKISFVIGILMLLITITSVTFSAQQKRLLTEHSYGIVFQSVISVKSSPGDSGKDLFILHSGTKVKITNSIGDWLEIRIADGNKGWILADALQKI